MKKTIIDLFEDSVVKYGAKTFLLEKKHRAFEPTTYAETKEQALEIGAGLAAAGIRPGDKVAILSEGCMHGSLRNWASSMPGRSACRCR